ncbi:hypothetical protein [Nocardioides ferulae]|uniref:hypothetical protein n=1 Tax=Nocardioides ferulae TaxID=2340821 RepID=UPI000EB1955D|nr:hypothetical protein [Nocardioides ferulae]
MSDEPQIWELTVGGHDHRVEASGSFQRTVRWLVDGALVSEKRSSDDRIRVTREPDTGEVLVRYSSLGKPRRATLLDPGDNPAEQAQALSGLGGVDLEPAAGSPAAAYEERLRRHPRRYAVLRAGGAVAGILLPLLLAAVVARFVISLPWPDIPWPDLPRIPWPDLPDLPGIPWPDWSLPDWSLPGWVRELLDAAGFVWPVLLAIVVARAEIRRRRKQDALRDELRAGTDPARGVHHDLDDQHDRREEDGPAA